MRVPRLLWALPAVTAVALAGPALAQQRTPAPAAKAPATTQAASKVFVYKSPT